MDEHRPQVADIFREHGTAFLDQYPASAAQRRVLKDIAACKTAILGGHKARCDRCGHEKIFYNSCRNRHCPQCQGAARAQWLVDRTSELLDTPYFHVVFTLPDELGPLALQNKEVLYGILFRAASETLLQIANDPKHLGAHIGFLGVLHTWGQRLDHHPHLHFVVPGGGLSPDRARWISGRESFFLPVRVLSRLFRGKFLAYLRDAIKQGRLKFLESLVGLEDEAHRKSFLSSLARTEWVVYSKAPFGGPKQVLKYLARYTHRVAISDQRIVSNSDGKVTFRYKDYRCGNVQRTMTVEATEFIRRFLQHVLPASFHRIRYFGFLANRARTKNIALVRKLLCAENADHCETPPEPQPSTQDSPATDTNSHTKEHLCPSCKKGHLVIVETIKPLFGANAAIRPAIANTS
jgi:hypothetical protein